MWQALSSVLRLRRRAGSSAKPTRYPDTPLFRSFDAGGTRVDVWVEEGGLQSIRVTDNGSGIEPEDVETAFYRHATSKIGDRT
ncbi:hypothetical protein E4V51_34000, partial [Paenibacillus sp. 28ISP30-2]|nr:hypothetical protein [Paenibacillus sp. 28ISP30-2]